jgi:hypothetical protein
MCEILGVQPLRDPLAYLDQLMPVALSAAV